MTNVIILALICWNTSYPASGPIISTVTAAHVRAFPLLYSPHPFHNSRPTRLLNVSLDIDLRQRNETLIAR